MRRKYQVHMMTVVNGTVIELDEVVAHTPPTAILIGKDIKLLWLIPDVICKPERV